LLKSKTTTLRWSGPTVKEYTTKGYVFTKKDDFFEVAISDLSPRSNKRIDVICDYCGDEYDTMYSNYARQKERSPNKKDCCKDCVHKKGKDTVINYSMKPSKQNLKKTIERINKEKSTSISNNLNFYSDDIFNLIKDKKELLSSFKKAFSDRRYKLIATYISPKKDLQFYCSKHKVEGKMSISINDFMNGKGCEHCKAERNVPKNGSFNTYKIVKNVFSEKNCTLISDSFMNAKVKLLYICNNHKDLGIQTATYSQFQKLKRGCARCHYDGTRGKHSHLWKGGVSPVNLYMRNILHRWKRDSMIACNFKCVITGDDFEVIHHLNNYSDMLQKALTELDLVGKDVKDYSDSELIALQKRLEQIHYENGLGICLRKDIHDLYHKLYGKVNNTPEEFEEFANRFHTGEFDEKLANLIEERQRKKEKKQKSKIHPNVLKASLLEINGVRKTIREWADTFGISITTLRRRIESGWKKSELHLPVSSIRHSKLSHKKVSA
jgi:hypothetical protein